MAVRIKVCVNGQSDLVNLKIDLSTTSKEELIQTAHRHSEARPGVAHTSGITSRSTVPRCGTPRAVVVCSLY